MSLQVQNMPIIPTSNISKPQISSSSEKSRSPLLDNFRSNLLPLLGLTDLTGHVLEFAKDQHGSRFIQQKLEMASKAEKDKIFDEIFPSILSLMTDVFGNYVIQKFVEHGSEEHQRNILAIVLPNVESLTVQMYGCRVIQKLLDASSIEQRKLIFRVSNQATSVVCRVSSRLLSVLVLFNFSFLVNFLHDEVVLKFGIYLQKLEPKLEEYIQDHNGNHVIQKCIEVLDGEDKQIILDRYAGKVITRELSYKNLHSVEYTQFQTLHISCHPYGCRIVQRLLEHCGQNQTSVLLAELLVNTDQLILDQYGNYVIQHILDHGQAAYKAQIVGRLEGRVLTLSQHKFASNVVEKCVTNASSDQRTRLIAEICADESSLGSMIKDQYGNYVVQKMIETAGEADLAVLMSKIKSHCNSLHKFSYGKYILAKLETYFKGDNGNTM